MSYLGLLLLFLTCLAQMYFFFLWRKSSASHLLFSVGVSLTIWTAAWLETKETLIVLPAMAFLIADLGIFFQFRSFGGEQAYQNPIFATNRLQMAMSSGVISGNIVLLTAGLAFIWQADWSQLLRPVSKVFGASLFNQFWQGNWALFLVTALIGFGLIFLCLPMVERPVRSQDES